MITTWTIDRRGSSGTWYRLTFHGTRFWRLQNRIAYEPRSDKPLYWHQMWDRGTRGERRSVQAKRTLAAFADLGIDAQRFLDGTHCRIAKGIG